MSQTRLEKIDRAFRIPLSAHLFGKAIHDLRPLWVRLGNLESWFLRERLESTPIDRPIFIAGLARSGTTILLELLSRSSHVVTHRYCDFPPVFTPYWWQEILRRAPRRSSPLTERAHGDGLPVGPESPEAMEEPLWMSFFPQIHSRGKRQELDRRTSHPAFELFYRDHIRKLLLARHGRRYLSKGNYNIARLAYLQEMFADARLIVPIRHPRTHIASLLKQHKLFAEGERRHPRALDHMRRVGHFEFGLGRRAIEVGDERVTTSIYELWDQGEEVRGWARYWAHLYGWLADRLDEDLQLREATLTVRYEDFCERPSAVVGALLAHTGLPDDGLSAMAAERVHAPNYYRPTYSPDEEAAIAEETAAVAERYGYAEESTPAAEQTDRQAIKVAVAR